MQALVATLNYKRYQRNDDGTFAEVSIDPQPVEARSRFTEIWPSRPPYSAASRTCRALGMRMITSSSAAVGCSAMAASKSALAAFSLTKT